MAARVYMLSFDSDDDGGDVEVWGSQASIFMEDELVSDPANYDLKIDMSAKDLSENARNFLDVILIRDNADKLEKLILANPMLTSFKMSHARNTVLHLAVLHGSCESVRLLVNRFDMNIYEKDSFGRSAFWYAVEKSDIPNELLNFMLEHASKFLNVNHPHFKIEKELTSKHLLHIEYIFSRCYWDYEDFPLAAEMAQRVKPFLNIHNFSKCPTIATFTMDPKYIYLSLQECAHLVILRGEPEILRILVDRMLSADYHGPNLLVQSDSMGKWPLCYLESGLKRGSGEAMLNELRRIGPVFTKDIVMKLLDEGMPEAIRFFIDNYDHLLQELNVNLFEGILFNDNVDIDNVVDILANHRFTGVPWDFLDNAINDNNDTFVKYIFGKLWFGNNLRDFLRNTSILTNHLDNQLTYGLRLICQLIYEALCPSANLNPSIRASMFFCIALEQIEDRDIMLQINNSAYKDEYLQIQKHVECPLFSKVPFHRDNILHDLLRQPREMVLKRTRHPKCYGNFCELVLQIPTKFHKIYELIEECITESREFVDACEALQDLTYHAFPYEISEIIVSFLDRPDVRQLSHIGNAENNVEELLNGCRLDSPDTCVV